MLLGIGLIGIALSQGFFAWLIVLGIKDLRKSSQSMVCALTGMEVNFESGNETLHATLYGDFPTTPSAGVVLCPPHPLHGGNRYDTRIVTVAREHLLFRKEAAPTKQSLIWADSKADFLKYLESIAYNKRTIVKVVNQLDKWVKVIDQPFDVIELFSKVKHSKRHLISGLRKLFSFYELSGVDKAFIDSLRARSRGSWAFQIVQCPGVLPYMLRSRYDGQERAICTDWD